MSDRMTPIAFECLMDQILTEMREQQSIFRVKNIRKEKNGPRMSFAGQPLENALGVAAGPHTQLAQNIVACYAGGARFIETKTVQKLYGEELNIPRPCIQALDEGYNVEWSSEYSPEMARDEYIKAWIAIHVMAKEFNLGAADGFQFNMSVGYTLEGIQSPSVDRFLDDLTDASATPCFKECKHWLIEHLHRFQHVSAADIEAIPSKICNTCTLSTMHGCPADDIERIAAYLLEKKGLHTMVKMNPTLLGYDYCRQLLDDLGYGYIRLNPHSFEADLQFDDAVPMLWRLLQKGKQADRFFGVKLSNTMAVKICSNELPGEEMYMSGKALYPLTLSLTAKISEAFGGDLTVSYSGGVDSGNIQAIYSCGIFPVTICTTLLQGAGYDKLEKLAVKLEQVPLQSGGLLDVQKLLDMVKTLTKEQANHKTSSALKKREEYLGYELRRQKDSVSCRVFCQSCVKVCPNRANSVIETSLGKRILHLDFACNECGNCQFLCPQPCTPYRDRLTFFDSDSAFEDSQNSGYFVKGSQYRFRLFLETGEGPLESLPDEIREAIKAQQACQPWLKR